MATEVVSASRWAGFLLLELAEREPRSSDAAA
jgi:hypothetical protein